jgi:hypothetical protein
MPRFAVNRRAAVREGADPELVVRTGFVRPGGSVSFRTILNGPGFFGFAANAITRGFDPTIRVRVGGRTFFDDDGGPGLNSFLRIFSPARRTTASITVAGFRSSSGFFRFVGTP